MSYDPGDKFVVNLPEVIPDWMQPFSPWWDIIREAHGKVVTIKTAPRSGAELWGKASSPEDSMLFVFTEENSSAICICWLNSLRYCNCSTGQLLRQGCRNSGHI